MTARDLPELLDAAYAAGTGAEPWAELGRLLCSATRAEAVSLLTGSLATGHVTLRLSENVPAWAQEQYGTYYHRLDPWVGTATRGGLPVGMHDAPPVWLGQELVDDGALRNSEFHADYLRRLDIFRIMGSLMPLGATGDLGLALYRPERTSNFDEGERRVLLALLPHLRRAMQLGHRLELDGMRDAAAALDAMPTGAVVVDETLRVLHANRAAQRIVRGGGPMLRREGATLRLGAQRLADANRLATLVRRVALAGADGGALSLQRGGAEGAVAALVMPLPALLRSPLGAGARGRRALVLLRDAAAPLAVDPALLGDLYGLTRAEAAVALDIADGRTAEQVAHARDVSVHTVRMQLRSAIAKTGAGSARMLARLIARLPTI